MPCSCDQRSIVMLVSSVPLTETIIAGQPRRVITTSSSRATRRPGNDVSATSARHSRVNDLGTAIARAKGLDTANADAAGRISLGLFFAETNGNQNIGNARSNRYKGSLQTGPSEDQNGQKKWAAIKRSIAAFDPALSLRDDKEEARVGNLDHRLNHGTAVRDALVSADADLCPQAPAIV